jgi:hypothetical protein
MALIFEKPQDHRFEIGQKLIDTIRRRMYWINKLFLAPFISVYKVRITINLGIYIVNGSMNQCD